MIKRSANGTDVVFIQREFLKSLKTSGMEHVRARQKNCGPRWLVTYVDSFIAQRHDTNRTIGNRSLNRLLKKKNKTKKTYIDSNSQDLKVGCSDFTSGRFGD